jgi:hypothetical protein
MWKVKNYMSDSTNVNNAVGIFAIGKKVINYKSWFLIYNLLYTFFNFLSRGMRPLITLLAFLHKFILII